jgi:hypothetical protein
MPGEKLSFPSNSFDVVIANQYRVIRDMMRTVDRNNVIMTHDSGSPREQIMPFWETTAAGSYLGWGKSTQLGSSLGWLLQLDGDNLRNAFLNAPWVKAIIPIRPGREKAAFNWLQRVSRFDSPKDIPSDIRLIWIRTWSSNIAKTPASMRPPIATASWPRRRPLESPSVAAGRSRAENSSRAQSPHRNAPVG